MAHKPSINWPFGPPAVGDHVRLVCNQMTWDNRGVIRAGEVLQVIKVLDYDLQLALSDKEADRVCDVYECMSFLSLDDIRPTAASRLRARRRR